MTRGSITESLDKLESNKDDGSFSDFSFLPVY